MTDDGLSFNDMCARFDVTARTLRHYEQIELLSPKRNGRSRFYGPREIARMTLILRGRRFGFTLEELRQWLLMYDEHGSRVQLTTFVVNADHRISQMLDQLKALEEDIEYLRTFRDRALADLANLPQTD
jgi:DNA-binding transcriptional MerR regulator